MLKELEAEIGLELLIRTPRGITLTIDGAEFLGYARQVVEQHDLLEQRWLNKTPYMDITNKEELDQLLPWSDTLSEECRVPTKSK